jgi:hypothetical protein
MATLKHDDIATRAYYIWEQEGRPEGRDQEHWFRALQEAGGVLNNARKSRSRSSSSSRKSDLEGWLRSSRDD